MLPHTRNTRVPRGLSDRGFTLVELMITLTVLAIVMISLMAVMYAAQRSKTSTARGIEATQAARAAVDMMARDLRSAGYAADRDWVASPQQPIAYVDSLQVLISANLSPYPDIAVTGPQYPQAYQPAGNPKPFPLNGTAWQPPIKYRSGAEVIRWTLDVNNDGVVNANDIADVNGVDARRTPNPDVLCNQEIKFNLFLRTSLTDGADLIRVTCDTREAAAPNRRLADRAGGGELGPGHGLRAGR